MESKKYKDKEWLYHNYITLSKSTRKLAQEANTTHPTILRWLKNYGIRIRKNTIHKPKNAKYKNKVWLHNEYGVLLKEASLIARDCGVSFTIIFYWLKKFNIPTRGLNFYKGKKSHLWKGGIRMNTGYIYIAKPEHPRADKTGYIYEHILIAERMLGRPLKYYGRNHKDNEIVHHLDGNKVNNNEDNLIVANNASLHRNIHHSLQKTGYKLFKDGIIKFNYKKKEYYYQW